MIILNYKDDGPCGICGQEIRATNPKNILYIFDDVEEARKVMKDVKHITSRKNPRIEYYWDDSMGDLIDYRDKNVK